MTTTNRTRTIAALLAAAALPLAACSITKTDGESTQSSSSTQSQEPSSTSSDTGSETSTDSATDTSSSSTDAGATGTATTSDGLTFAIPASWLTIDVADIRAGGDVPPEFDQLAQNAGTTAQAYLEQLPQETDIIVLSDEATTFRSNINVVNSTSKPTEESFRDELSALDGASGQGVRTTDSPIGQVLDGSYILDADGTEVQGRMIVAPTDGGSAVITVSSADRAEADRVAEAIIESLSA